MKMEYWIMNTDPNQWKIIQNGNSKKSLGRDSKGGINILPPVLFEEHVAVQRETKARTLLLQSLPEDHMADFYHLDDAREIWLAVKAQFGGNKESKKMRKTMLKQAFSEFIVSEEEGLHKGYDRGGLEYLSFDDLYNKLRSLEIDVKGGSSYGSRSTIVTPTHSAFIVQEQTALGKDKSNPLTVGSLLKITWSSIHHLLTNEVLTSPEHTATCKDISNPFMVVMVCQKPLGYFSSPMIYVPRAELGRIVGNYKISLSVVPAVSYIVPAGRYVVPAGR
nr:xylulose kinase-1 [Tanacetum cinerariifolium]